MARVILHGSLPERSECWRSSYLQILLRQVDDLAPCACRLSARSPPRSGETVIDSSAVRADYCAARRLQHKRQNQGKCVRVQRQRAGVIPRSKVFACRKMKEERLI
jgi:hypothetical protein